MLPLDCYHAKAEKKDLIVLHHTVGGSARSTIEYWQTKKNRIATAFLVERDGSVLEAFPASAWAFHVGVPGEPELEKRSIGIEIANEGPLIESEGKFYCFGKISSKTEFQGEVTDCGSFLQDELPPWRGFRYFAAYTPAAMNGVAELVERLIEEFDIARLSPADHLSANAYHYRDFKGVLSHAQLRADKTDVHPGFDWELLQRRCELEWYAPNVHAASASA